MFSYKSTILMKSSYQNTPLGNSMLNLILLDQMLLLESLDCVDLTRVLLLREDDLAVTACADHLHQFEIVN